jgi:hypothetical protein
MGNCKTNEMDRKIEPSQWYQRLIGFIIDYAFAMLLSHPFAYNFDYTFNLTYFEALQVFTPMIYLIKLLFLESIFNKSLGKLITCSIVRNKKNLGRTNFGRVFLRTVFRLIPFESLSFISKRPIGWHDKFSGTTVLNSKYSYALFFKRFKFINKGFLRINWVLSIVIGIPTLGIGFVIYWIVARVYLWIYDGFNSEPMEVLTKSTE